MTAADGLRLTVPITFLARSGELLHSPMVEVELRGQISRFVLDTGSDTHLITAELAGAAGLTESRSEPGTEHAGAEADSGMVGDIEVILGGSLIPLAEVVSIPGPAKFAGWGIGGILSPHNLATSGFVVLDLLNDSLRVLADDEAARERLQMVHPQLELLEMLREPGLRTVVVRGAVRPYPETLVLLNTRTRETEFARSAVPTLEIGEERILGYGVGGGAVMGGSAGRQIVEIGGAEVIVEDLVVRDTIPVVGGMLGTDVLRGTVLAVGADLVQPVRWQVPAQRLSSAEML